jgi:tetratricopeptide (TPR) repeat protein
MKNIYGIIVLVTCFALQLPAQKNVLGKGEDQLKMFNAQQAYYAGDFQKAANIYKDLLTQKPNDANLVGRIADCYFNLGQFTEALANAEKAKGIDEKAYDNTSLILGKLYHQDGKLNEALTEYNTFKSIVGNTKKAQESGIDKLIAQINTAKELMAHPVDVKITNMGDVINSEFDDKAPMITADGRTIIFTSRRPGKSSLLDVEGDNKYFEDIYISRWDTVKKMWADAELIPGAINTEGHDACVSISPDGKQIFLYKNDANGESRGGDIYASRLSSSGKWGAPKSVGKPINTTYWEGGACVSPDGKTLYLISERPGGLGHGDIYVAQRKTRTEWDTPVNIGAPVNTDEDEGGLFLAPDGKTLFFTSKGHNSMGGYDIFKTIFENGKWSTPVNLGYPINTVSNDLCFSVTIDGKMGYFGSNRKGGLGERDVYQVDLSNYPVLEKDMKSKPKTASNAATPVMAILKGDIFDGTAGKGVEAELKVYDEAGAEVGSTTSTEATGEYFITLLAGKSYHVKINLQGYKPVDEKVEVAAAKDGATTVVKHYLLYKE